MGHIIILACHLDVCAWHNYMHGYHFGEVCPHIYYWASFRAGSRPTHTVVFFFTILVTGEANFAMPCTRLTIGGFTQPGIARALIELPSNAEKGLSHRFIWLFPKPLFGAFTTL